MPLKRDLQGHPEKKKNGLSYFLCDESEKYGIM